MSTKSFSNSTRNSFGVLGTLDDHLDNILSPKKEKKAEIPARNNNLASKKPQAPKIDVTQPKNSSNNDKSANGSKKKEDKKFSNSSNETSVSTLPTEKTSQSVQTSSSQRCHQCLFLNDWLSFVIVVALLVKCCFLPC